MHRTWDASAARWGCAPLQGIESLEAVPLCQIWAESELCALRCDGYFKLVANFGALTCAAHPFAQSVCEPEISLDFVGTCSGSVAQGFFQHLDLVTRSQHNAEAKGDF